MSKPTREEIEQLLLGQRVAAIVWANKAPKHAARGLYIDAIELEDGTQLTFAPIRGCGPKIPQTVRMVVVDTLEIGNRSYPVKLDPDMPEGDCVLVRDWTLPATPEEEPEEELEMPVFPQSRWEGWEP